MGKFLRWFFTLVIILLLLAGLALWGALRYARPEPGLNLAGAPVDLGSKLGEMAMAGKPELVLTDEDINNLLKRRLAENPELAPDLALYGAAFRLEGDRLVGDLGVRYKELLPAGAVVRYKLSWQEPELVAEPERLSVRAVTLPLELLDTVRVPVLEGVPEWVAVKDVAFEADGVHILLKANLPELPGLQ